MKNRIIKFRAWDGIRITTSGIMFNCSTSILQVPDGSQMKLMQFTGLFDNSGKEIYEGDILKVEWQTPSTGGYFQMSDSYCEHEEILSVCWDYDGFAYLKQDGKYFTLSRKGKHRIEIIGNIYDNPELLTPNS